MSALVLFGSFFVLLLLTVPIGYAIGISSLIAIYYYSDIPLIIIAQKAITGVDSFPLLAIPFFMLAGNLMSSGGIAKRLVNFFDSLIGHVTGGLGMVTIIVCMFFAAISGSGPATVSAIGSFMMPAMKEKGYDPGYSAALTAAAGTIGVVIPPSIPFVIYGVVTGTSIGSLFLAGIIPGILMGLALMVTNYRTAKKNGWLGSGQRPKLRSVGKATKNAFWALMSPVIILGGIYGGIFTPTEAAAVSCVYTFVIGKFVYKELDMKKLMDCLKDTVLLAGATSFMIGLSSGFAFLLTMKQVPNTVAEALLSVSDNKIVILLIINVFLLIIGCFIDNISSCTILAPILLPVVVALGVDPIHFGIIMTMNLAIGFITPPYGANLFIASAVGNTPMESIIKRVWPLILTIVVVLLLTTFIPGLSMLLV